MSRRSHYLSFPHFKVYSCLLCLPFPFPLSLSTFFPSCSRLLWIVVGGGLPVFPGIAPPCHLLAIPPETSSVFSLCGSEDPLSVLSAILPPSIITSPVGPREDSVALLLVRDVTSCIHPPVSPFEDPVAVHPVGLPLARVGPSICPCVSAVSMNLIVLELASEPGTLGPPEGALPVLLPHMVGALEVRAIRPHLLALSVFLVIAPLSCVSRPICVQVGPVPCGLIVYPLS
mmetsp:Transcript_14178/g.28428  ORF Transcript_14178/g.28428 Transcript_14178/m.28428 type:complete len:230 (-) Transcript_14178:401-1090(-)